MNNENINKAVSSKSSYNIVKIDLHSFLLDGIPATSISISPLGSQNSTGVILFDIYIYMIYLLILI